MLEVSALSECLSWDLQESGQMQTVSQRLKVLHGSHLIKMNPPAALGSWSLFATNFGLIGKQQVSYGGCFGVTFLFVKGCNPQWQQGCTGLYLISINDFPSIPFPPFGITDQIFKDVKKLLKANITNGDSQHTDLQSPAICYWFSTLPALAAFILHPSLSKKRVCSTG